MRTFGAGILAFWGILVFAVNFAWAGDLAFGVNSGVNLSVNSASTPSLRGDLSPKRLERSGFAEQNELRVRQHEAKSTSQNVNLARNAANSGVNLAANSGVNLSANSIKLNSNISSIKLASNAVFIGTDGGEILRLSDKSVKTLLTLPKIQNYFAQNLGARIYSLDVLNDKFLLVSEGDFGAEILHICEFKNAQNSANSGVNSTKNAVNSSTNLNCKSQKIPFTNTKKAFFIDENTAILALLSSDIKLVNLSDLKAKKEHKFSLTSLNDVVLSEDRATLLVASESGELQIFDTKSWRNLANYDQIYKDTLDQIDLKSGVVMACGKEKLVGIVRGGVQKAAQKPFLTYACALSPSAKIGAVAQFQSNEQNTLEILDTQNFKVLKSLNLRDFFAKFIIFLNENFILISGGNEIRFENLQ